MNVNEVGALCFGVVTGYIAYRTLARSVDKAAISDLATVIGVVGGGVVTGLFAPSTSMFGYYSIGLLVGMAAFFVLFAVFNGKDAIGVVMGAPTLSARGGGSHTSTPDRPDTSGPRL
jgi:hypothetical protein